MEIKEDFTLDRIVVFQAFFLRKRSRLHTIAMESFLRKHVFPLVWFNVTVQSSRFACNAQHHYTEMRCPSQLLPHLVAYCAAGAERP